MLRAQTHSLVPPSFFPSDSPNPLFRGQAFLLAAQENPVCLLATGHPHYFNSIYSAKSPRNFCGSSSVNRRPRAEFTCKTCLPCLLSNDGTGPVSECLFSCLCLPVSTAPSTVPIMHQVSATMRSITLSWPQPEQPNGIILDYEIRYYEKVSHVSLQLCKAQGQLRAQKGGYGGSSEGKGGW